MHQKKVPKHLKSLFFVSPAPDVMILPLTVTSDVLMKAPGWASKTWRADVELAIDEPTFAQRQAFESRGQRIFLTDDMQFWNGQNLATTHDEAVRLAKQFLRSKIKTHEEAISKLKDEVSQLDANVTETQ